MQKFKIVGKPLLGEKYVHGRRIRPSLVTTRSASVRAHALRSDQNKENKQIQLLCKLIHLL